MAKKAGTSAAQLVEEPMEETEMFAEDDRLQRRSRPGMRAFEGASMGGPDRYTEEEMTVIVDHADAFVKALGQALSGYQPQPAAKADDEEG